MRTRVRSKRARPLADARSSPVAALELVASVCTIGMYAARPEEGVGVRGRQAVHMVVGHVCASARRASGVRRRSCQGVSRRFKAFPGLSGCFKALRKPLWRTHRRLLRLRSTGREVVALIKREQHAAQTGWCVPGQPGQPVRHLGIVRLCASAKGAHEHAHLGSVEVTCDVEGTGVVAHRWVHAARAATATAGDVAMVVDHRHAVQAQHGLTDERHRLGREVQLHHLRLEERRGDERVVRVSGPLARSTHQARSLVEAADAVGTAESSRNRVTLKISKVRVCRFSTIRRNVVIMMVLVLDNFEKRPSILENDGRPSEHNKSWVFEGGG